MENGISYVILGIIDKTVTLIILVGIHFLTEPGWERLDVFNYWYVARFWYPIPILADFTSPQKLELDLIHLFISYEMCSAVLLMFTWSSLSLTD